MRIPAWVPQPICVYVNLLLGDEEKDPFGLLNSLSSAKTRADWEAVVVLEADVSLLKRLAGQDDDRMRDAYEILACEFAEDMTWRNFAASAWAARMNYLPFRGRLERATEMALDIAKKAAELAELLNTAGNLHDHWPSELYHVPTLLKATASHDLLWPTVRNRLLGDLGNDETFYLWSTAPSVPQCLQRLSETAELYEPKEIGMIGAAVSRRERNVKTEYIRAFAAKLIEHKIHISNPVMKAMAITANVAINDESIDTSAQDVKQALRDITRDR